MSAKQLVMRQEGVCHFSESLCILSLSQTLMPSLSEGITTWHGLLASGHVWAMTTIAC